MTVAQKRQLTVGIATTVLGGLVLLAVRSLTAQVMLRPEVEARFMGVEAEVRETKAIALDHLCSDTPTHWRCK